MELLFKLNKAVAAACGLKSGEQPSIAVECDLDLSGRFADCFFVALKDRLVTVTDGKAAVSVPTASIKRVDLDVGVGAGALTADTASGKVTLARFSMKHIDRFTAVLARDPRPVFATSFFGYLDEDTDRTDKMRKIVRRYAAERLIFTDGLQLLDDETLISADGTHPDARGQEQIAARWSRIMAETLANRTAR